MPQSYNDVLCVGQRPQEFLVPNGDKAGVTKAKTYLGSMKYTTAEMEHSLQSLSGGQRAKLFLLKMILDRANVLILDEPTRNFSPLSAPAVRTLLADFKGCIISISHDRKYLAQVPDIIYELTADGLIERRDFKQTAIKAYCRSPYLSAIPKNLKGC